MTIRPGLDEHMVIRQAGEADADFVAGLAEGLLEHGSPAWHSTESLLPGFREVLRSAVRNQDERSTVLIAEVDAKPLGFISLKVVIAIGGAERAHVADLAVTANARCQGVGSALMKAAETWADARGIHTVSLDVWATNDSAMRFYAGRGYITESSCLIKPINEPEAAG